VALSHFKAMAGATSHLRKAEAAAGKAKAGYWLGRTLKELGRDADARAMFSAAMAYSTTFYGQLSASEMKVPVTRDRVKHVAEHYPVKDIYWHDNRIPKEFVLAVIREESRFKQHANSNKNARGMMQVLDGTAKGVGKAAGVNIDIGLMRTNADYNIAVGSRYLADQVERYTGNPMLAAAAYNAGPLRADEWIARFGDPRGSRVDPVDWVESIPFGETRNYVQKVMSSYVTYLALKK
jgi:Soluble lytic murein transglycosylase and related regulatory proteins (some contain LysM/invasin domains)